MRQSGSRTRTRSISVVGRINDATRGLSAEFPRHMANHLPMVLHALRALGAGEQRLSAFAERYIAKHSIPTLPVEAGPPLNEDTWRGARGDRGREAALRSFFRDRVRQQGIEHAIGAAMPDLQDGVAASATHPLMRLAYGVLRGDAAEVGDALGYWAATYLAMPERPMADGHRSLGGAMQALRDDPEIGALKPADGLLWHWIADMFGRPAFRRLAVALDIDSVTLPSVRDHAAALYAGTMSFEALHAVTGAHWLRITEPHVPDPRALVVRYAEVMLALMPKMGMPDIPEPAQMACWRQTTVPSWAAIAAAAVASDDEHDHSLVFSAREEWRYTGDPIYRYLAACRMGMLPR